MWHVGLDVHEKTSSICILDENGKVIKTKTINGPWLAVLRFFETIKEPFTVCYEASCGYGLLFENLSPLAQHVVVAHPGQLRLIFRSKRKNDRVDARKLAKLLFLDEVPQVYVPSANMRHWRETIEFRRRMVDKRTRCKNALRALLRSRKIEAPGGLWTIRGLTWLGQADLYDELAALRRDDLLEEVVSLNKRILRITKALDAIAAKDSGVTLLRTIPGVGPRTAEAVVAYVAAPNRFRRIRQVGAYFGLVPSQDASGGTNRLGHITREGPATVRKYLTEATWQLIRRCDCARARFERICRGRKDRRKVALVAVAHHLVRCMLSMLQTGEVWRAVA